MEKEALEKMTVAELREQAKKLPGVKGVSSMKKGDLVELLSTAAPAEDESAPKAKAPAEDKTKTGAPPDKAQIKKRIRELKAEKREALSQQNREKARECTREIHLQKRRLRKLLRLGNSA